MSLDELIHKTKDVFAFPKVNYRAITSRNARKLQLLKEEIKFPPDFCIYAYFELFTKLCYILNVMYIVM